MNNTSQTITVEVDVTLKCEVEVTMSDDGLTRSWRSEVIAIENCDPWSTGGAHSLAVAIDTKITQAAHDAALAQLP